ncbi:MAG: hypothetical protein GW839_02440 [Flavobacteriales bacterium]|nr:hypothetical protein [Flavobacteriia bacterium]NCP04921.1 hypothetical protein [Flavobacteriales bacterium]PIV95202.1 MAG: hypothetical protein COW44_00080 [Flavobacteriaceae bacterium CG17_big_fil_post_rev_8_21_14_2_50_33_15]PIY11718.1 MAG: hypothetical protein COZ17_06070 [Flavobacteriaceae bacterium CG_4_10_14_3_um_filter_33_47]PJB16967.1 MAG: hypothetical protein CO117_13550 [Flavobacteriaceae bacterium CG_4_9_14_3_um_filter_33_16]
MVNSCKKTTELIDKQTLTSLSIKERLQLYIHKSMCKTCTAYEQQSKFIDNAVWRWISNKTKPNIEESNNRKKKILQELDKS